MIKHTQCLWYALDRWHDLAHVKPCMANVALRAVQESQKEKTHKLSNLAASVNPVIVLLKQKIYKLLK